MAAHSDRPASPAHPLVVFSAQFLPNYGGVEQFVAHLARTLARGGQPVCVVAANNYRAAEREVLEPGVDVVRLPCLGPEGDRLAFPRRNAAFRRLWAGLEELEPLGVLANNLFYPHSLLAMRYARAQGLRPVLLSHASSYMSVGKPLADAAGHAYEQAMARCVAAYDPACYGVSEMARDWLATFGIQGEGVLHNAVDAAAFRALASERDFRAELGIAESTLLVAFTGRLIPEKGTAELLEIARLLEAEQADVRLVVAGDGPELSRLQAAGLSTLTVTGRLPREDVSALLQQADLFVFPSKYPEGLPTALLEAGACGLTSIATDVGGVREVMPSEAFGEVLAQADPASFAAAIIAYLDHRDVLAARGLRVRERVEEVFSWDRTAGDVLAACERAQHTSAATRIPTSA